MGPFGVLSRGSRGEHGDGSHAATGPRRGWGRGPWCPPCQRRGGKPGGGGGFGGIRGRSGAVTVNRPDARPDTDTSVATSHSMTDICDIERGAMPFRAWLPFSLLCPRRSPPRPNSPFRGKRRHPAPPVLSAAQGHPCYFSPPGPGLLSGF